MRVFAVLLSDIFFPSVFTSHSASNSRVSEFLKIVLSFFMSEARWTAIENVIFSKRCIVIKLPVRLGSLQHPTIFIFVVATCRNATNAQIRLNDLPGLSSQNLWLFNSLPSRR